MDYARNLKSPRQMKTNLAVLKQYVALIKTFTGSNPVN